MDHRLAVLAAELGGPRIDFLQVGRLAVEAQRVGGADELAVERPGFLHAAHLAGEAQAAVGGRLAGPAALGLLGDDVEAAGDIGGGIGRLLRARQHFGVERAGNRRLLDQRARIARMQRIECGAHRQRLLDDGAQIGAGALGAVGQHERGVLEAGVDQIVFERLRSPSDTARRSRASPCRAAAGRYRDGRARSPPASAGRRRSSSSVRIWAPSTSASVMMMILW